MDISVVVEDGEFRGEVRSPTGELICRLTVPTEKIDHDNFVGLLRGTAARLEVPQPTSVGQPAARRGGGPDADRNPPAMPEFRPLGPGGFADPLRPNQGPPGSLIGPDSFRTDRPHRYDQFPDADELQLPTPPPGARFDQIVPDAARFGSREQGPGGFPHGFI